MRKTDNESFERANAQLEGKISSRYATATEGSITNLIIKVIRMLFGGCVYRKARNKIKPELHVPRLERQDRADISREM